jgi:hypothetical protein
MSKYSLILFFASYFFCISQLPAQKLSREATDKVDRMVNANNSVDAETAKKYVKSYKRKWNMHRRAIVGKRYDARACWFDIGKLQQFLKEADSLAKITYKQPISGVRFYYMAYPKGQVGPDTTNYSRSHSLLMVATIKKKTDKNEEYNQDVFLGMDTAMFKFVAYQVIENNGTLCPPLDKTYCQKGLVLLEYAEGKAIKELVKFYGAPIFSIKNGQ